MNKCITCGRELHPERAEKYNYCMSPECQEKNRKPLTMVAIGVNKAAEQYMILDEHTKDELASGKYHDQRRGSFGTSLSSSDTARVPEPRPARKAQRPPQAEVLRPPQAEVLRPPQAEVLRPPQAEVRKVTRQPWSRSQQKLALLYNEQGLRPDEIAQKLGLSTYIVTQIILNAKSRGKL
jgi:hypothetical protein